MCQVSKYLSAKYQVPKLYAKVTGTKQFPKKKKFAKYCTKVLSTQQNTEYQVYQNYIISLRQFLILGWVQNQVHIRVFLHLENNI